MLCVRIYTFVSCVSPHRSCLTAVSTQPASERKTYFAHTTLFQNTDGAYCTTGGLAWDGGKKNSMQTYFIYYLWMDCRADGEEDIDYGWCWRNFTVRANSGCSSERLPSLCVCGVLSYRVIYAWLLDCGVFKKEMKGWESKTANGEWGMYRRACPPPPPT